MRIHWNFESCPHNTPNNFVPSLPATLINSFSPPGWNARYGVTLYTFPLITVQASWRVLCCLSIEGVTRNNVGTPLEISMWKDRHTRKWSFDAELERTKTYPKILSRYLQISPIHGTMTWCQSNLFPFLRWAFYCTRGNSKWSGASTM